MALKLITPSAVEPITLDEAKAHIRVEDQESDVLITSLIGAAREYCEGFQNRQYITATWELWLDAWPDKDYIAIPRPPLQAVENIKYYSADNMEYTLDTADYFVDDKNEPGKVVLAYGKAWPIMPLRPASSVAVRFVAGYGDTAEGVPMAVRQATMLLIGFWYDNREAAVSGIISREIEFSVKSLLWLDRVVPV